MISISMYNGSHMQLHDADTVEETPAGNLVVRGNGYAVCIKAAQWKKFSRHNIPDEE